MEEPSPQPQPPPPPPPHLPELPLFSCREAYVYRVPPASTAGHRAEMWDVNNWLATVKMSVVQQDEDAFVRLLDSQSGELFAECPVPTDKPLSTAVEGVVDSSRYAVLRIVDRETQRHAFIGIGFRERSEASEFNAALHEYLQYVRRRRTAEAMRAAYEERQAQAAAAAAEGALPGAEAGSSTDYAIKDGERLTLKIALQGGAPSSRPGGGFVSGGGGGRRGMLGKTFSLLMGGSGGSVAGMSPRASSPAAAGAATAAAAGAHGPVGRLQPHMCISPAASVSSGAASPSSSSGGAVGSPCSSADTLPSPFAGNLGSAGSAGRPLGRVSGGVAGEDALSAAAARLHSLQLHAEATASRSPSAASSSTTAAAAAAAVDGVEEDDEFGEFH